VYDTLQKTVTVYATPIAKFYLEKDTYKFETPVLFTNQSTNANQFHWTFGDGDTSSEFSPTHYYDHTFGWQQACLQAYYEGAPCQDTVCDSLYILFTPLIGVPNAFTPNGDGINDFVRVEGKGIIELEFRIFNRWGLEIYYGTDPNKGWDGTYKGIPQEMEVYTYLVIARFINKEPVQLKGNITLLR
jgi:gliding motility-associated-like protein